MGVDILIWYYTFSFTLVQFMCAETKRVQFISIRHHLATRWVVTGSHLSDVEGVLVMLNFSSKSGEEEAKNARKSDLCTHWRTRWSIPICCHRSNWSLLQMFGANQLALEKFFPCFSPQMFLLHLSPFYLLSIGAELLLGQDFKELEYCSCLD